MRDWGQVPNCDERANRDDIAQLLRGLQGIYRDWSTREKVFKILKQIQPKRARDGLPTITHTGRPGMDLWCVLVLASLRLVLNADYDRVCNQANQHADLRSIMGHDREFNNPKYKLQTIKDNIRLFTPEVLAQINQVVVQAGHCIVAKKGVPILATHCDSFVVETDIKHPSDIAILEAALRKSHELTAKRCSQHGLTVLRQSAYYIRQFHNGCRRVSTLRHSTSKDPIKKEDKKDEIHQVHRDYLNRAT